MVDRYVLLVSELLNKTHVDHADYPLLEEALTKIQVSNLQNLEVKCVFGPH